MVAVMLNLFRLVCSTILNFFVIIDSLSPRGVTVRLHSGILP